MRRFTVVWQNEAMDDLATIWLSASDRASVTTAANSIDHQLSDDPLTTGEDVREGLRAIDMPPLRAFYNVHEADKKVEVQCVRLMIE